MPLYFFHIRDGDTLIVDEEGRYCQDLETALAEGRKSALELAAEQVKAGQLVDGSVIEVTDQAGNVSVKIPLRIFLTQ